MPSCPTLPHLALRLPLVQTFEAEMEQEPMHNGLTKISDHGSMGKNPEAWINTDQLPSGFFYIAVRMGKWMKMACL